MTKIEMQALLGLAKQSLHLGHVKRKRFVVFSFHHIAIDGWLEPSINRYVSYLSLEELNCD